MLSISEAGPDKVRFGDREFVVSRMDHISGDTIHLAIRPENIEFIGEDGPSASLTSSNIIETAVEVINFLGAVVRITFILEGEEMQFDMPEKSFEKINLKRRDTIRLYFPPEAFHAYGEMFKKLI